MIDNKIQFIGLPQPAQDGGLTCFASVKGELVKCHFTWEALCECGHLPQPATAEDSFDAWPNEALRHCGTENQGGGHR
jgi:hypothetical protein